VSHNVVIFEQHFYSDLNRVPCSWKIFVVAWGHA